VSNVWEAMKKHQAEIAAKAATGATPIMRDLPPEGDDATLVDIELVSAPEAQPSTAVAAPPRKAKAPESARSVMTETSAPRGKRITEFSELIVAHHDRGGGVTEEYRSLRTNLLARCANGKFGYIITSAEAGEGKTVTTLNLAVVLAEQAERRTIIVDGDMRRATMHKMIRTAPGPGLAEVLRGDAKLDDAIQPTVYPNLSVLPSNRTDPHKIGDLLGTMERDEIFAALRREFDYVLVDTPPINIASDAAILGQAVGEALVVVRMNKTRQESIDKVIRLLHSADVNLSGMILTHRKYYIPNYLYRYS